MPRDLSMVYPVDSYKGWGKALYMSWLAIAYFFFSELSLTSNASHQTIIARSGMVASDDVRCSRIGRDVLREGGHAVDGAVATAFCLGVVRSASSGIGGGSFMLVRQANGKAQGFEMRGMAPKRASEDMYAGHSWKQYRGASAIAVPGELAGLHKAWKQYGKLSWKRLMYPAEKLARNGFKISKPVSYEISKFESSIREDKGLRGVFTSGQGSLLKEGDTCQNTNLANTLREISNYGPQALYNGSIGINLVKDVQSAGGIMTVEDLQRYQAKSRKPISARILGHKIIGMPPTTSGGATMILILNILAQYGFPTNISRSLQVHRMIEAFKFAYATRMNLGDPNFVDVTNVVSNMLSPTFAAQLGRTISPNRTFDPQHYGSRWNQIHDHGTTHICVVDRARNAVSMTTSVNFYFGAKFLSPSTGLVLNNEMGDFSTPGAHASPANFIRPFKRPLSSMTPTIVSKGGKLRAVLGSAGGIYIPAATTQVFLNHFVRVKDPISSIAAPRFYHKLLPNVLYYENFTSVFGDHYEAHEKTVAGLRRRGHSLNMAGGWTTSQLIVHQLEGPKSGMLLAASDTREGGLPAGY